MSQIPIQDLISPSSHKGRNRRLINSLMSAFLSKGLILIVNAVVIPIMVRYLGAEYFGIWVTLTTGLSLLMALDLGISNSLTNFISEAFAVGDQVFASKYSTTSLIIMALFSILVGFVAWLFWPFLNWQSMFHLSNASEATVVSRATAAALCVFLLGMPSSLSAKLLGGYQEVQIANIVSVLASLVSLVLIVSLVMCHAGLVALVVATSGAVVGINVLSLVWIWLYHKPWLLPKLYHLDRDAAQRLMRTGWDFFILQISGIIVFNTDNLIVTHYLGPAQVAPYSVTWRLVGYSAILQMLITPALWPAYSEAFVRGDMVWIRKTFWRIFRLTMGTSLGFVIILGFEGRWLIRMWASKAAEPPESLLLAMCVWILISTYMNNSATILVAKGEIRLQAWCSILAAALNLWVSIFLVQRIGSLGVILGTILSYLLILVGPQSWMTWKVLKGAGPECSTSDAVGEGFSL